MSVLNNGDVQMNQFKYDDENASVGIGTQTPSASLHLKSTTPTPQLEDKVGIHFSSYDSIANASIKHVREDKKDRLEFSCGINGFDFAQMSLNNDGNLGIGTTTPRHKLEVKLATNKNIAFKGDMGEIGSVAGIVAYDDDGQLNSVGIRGTDIRFATANSEVMRIDSTGYVFIKGGKIGFENTDSTNSCYISNVGSSGKSTLNVGGNSQNTGGLFVLEEGHGNHNGNVGIGTDSPETHLHIKGTQPVIRLEDTNTNLYSEMYADTGNGDLLFIADKSNGGTNPMMSFRIGGTAVANEKLRIQDNGLEIFDGALKLGTSAAGRNNFEIFPTDAGARGLAFYDRTNNAYRILITNDGNVGIGTTTPGSTYKLNVSGNTYVHGHVSSNGTILTSDDRIKHNEQPIKNALNTLSKITPKKYIKTAEMYEANHDFALNAENKPIDTKGEEVECTIEAGVIAQELKKIDELAFTVSDEQKDKDGNVVGPHAVNYNSLLTYAISAINELNEKVSKLESDLVISKFKLAELEHNQRNSK